MLIAANIKSFLFACLIAGNLILGSACSAEDSSSVAENAILTGDWQTVYRLLQDSHNFSDTAVAPILWAQACLITQTDCPQEISEAGYLTPVRKEHLNEWLTLERAKHPDNQWILYLSGINSLYYQKLNEALSYFDRAIDLNPLNAPALVMRGMLYIQQGRKPQALKDLRQARAADTTFLQPYLALGNYYQSDENYDSAIVYYDRAESLGYRNSWLYYERGVAYKDLGNLPVAIAELSEAIRLDPSSAAPYLSRATIYVENKLELLAYYDYKDYLRFLPPKQRAAVGSRMDVVTQFVDTMETEIQKLGPENLTYDFYLQQADAYRENENWTESLAYYIRAMELDSTRYEPYLWRGYIFDELGHPHRAMADLNKAVAMAPHKALVYRTRAESYLNRFIKSKDTEVPEYGEKQAIADFNRAVTIQPDDLETHYFRALTYDLIADTVNAKSDFNFVLKNATPADSFQVRMSKKYLDGYTQ
jgi:tetratricopeptide (TPR) repeat protein